MTERESLKLALEELAVRFSEGWHEGIKIDASDIMLLSNAAQALAQPEQEQIAVWLEKECDEQYLADRVRAGDYAKEKGHTENCAALADDIGKRHLSPSLVGVGVKDYTAQPEQEPVAWPCVIAEADFSENIITLTMQCTDYKVSAGKHWLSTTPPQRTWVGLDNDDLIWIYSNSDKVGQAISNTEAKLKEKNGYDS